MFGRFYDNLGRVRHLLRLYELIGGPNRGRRPTNSADILRAAVVLLHATMEELLRTAGLRYIPTASKDYLDQIPLTGVKPKGNPKNILLGDLAVHRGKSVDQLLEDAIANHLNQSSYNSVEQITGILEAIVVDVDPYRHLFPRLAEMTSRRHDIVHQADKNPKTGRGQHKVRSISSTTVKGWADTVEELAAQLEDDIEERKSGDA